MRTHEFTFKKTVKRVKQFKAISIDLTVSEAKMLYQVFLAGTGAARPDDPEWTNPDNIAMGDLMEAIQKFLAKSGVYVE